MSEEKGTKEFIHLVLTQAVKDGATELSIGVAEDATTPLKYKVKGQWYEMAPPPARVHPGLIAELGRLASLPEGPFPKQGTIQLTTDDVLSKWELEAPTAEGEWMLTRSS